MDDDDEPQFVGTQSDVPDFRPGNITRIKMVNFLTFTNATFFPAPRMNLVIGPNGSGKSTIVACVCLVFAGSPRLLGRNPDLGAFVRHGASSAEIEAHLFEPRARRGYVAVRRQFDTDGKGSFFIDDQRVKKEEVLARIVRKYDIQLDNLSQFMPQEKIAEFTNIKPDELLTITVRSLGGMEKEKLLQTLIEKDRDLAGEADSIEKSEATLKKLQERQDECEVEVTAIKEQQKMQDNIRLHKILIELVHESELLEEVRGHKATVTELENQTKVLTDELRNASSGSINRIQQEVDAAKEEAQAGKQAMLTAEDRRKHIMDTMEENTVAVQRLDEDIKENLKSEERDQISIRNAETKLARAQEELDGLRQVDIGAIDESLKELNDRYRGMATAKSNHALKKDTVLEEQRVAKVAINYANRDLEQWTDPREQRYSALSQRHDVRSLRAVETLINQLKREGRFRGDVFGPVAVHIEVGNRYHARIMESAISGFLLTAFVCEFMQDSRLLLDECRRQLRSTPDVVTVPTTRNDDIDVEAIRKQVPYRPVDDRLRQLGIVATIPEIFKAPDAVVAALNAQLGLHQILVGNDRAFSNQESLRNEEGLQAWYTPKNRVNLIGSRYDSSVKNLRVDTHFEHIRGELFSGSVEEARRRREEHKAIIAQNEQILRHTTEKLQNIDEEISNIDRDIVELRKEGQHLRQKRTQVKASEQRVQGFSDHVEELKQQVAGKNVLQERDRLLQAKSDQHDLAIAHFTKVARVLKSLVKNMTNYDQAATTRMCAERELAVENSKHDEKRDELKKKQEELTQARQEYATIKQEWKEKKRANARIGEDLVENNGELIQKLVDLGSNEVERLIEDLEAKVGDLISGSETVLDEYNQRANKIKDLIANVEKLRSTQDRRETEFQDKKQRFLQWLQEGVGKMRSKFSGLYSRLGCSGDLSLINADSGRLGELALEVLVSYRDDVALRPISNAANSGGEKMCCTMIFSFALQLLDEERVPPFVIVDELNQGLDLHNEQKIMGMMIEDAEKPNAPQSFVITPKLLSDLPLHSCTKTHIIFNGPVRGKNGLLESTD